MEDPSEIRGKRGAAEAVLLRLHQYHHQHLCSLLWILVNEVDLPDLVVDVLVVEEGMRRVKGTKEQKKMKRWVTGEGSCNDEKSRGRKKEDDMIDVGRWRLSISKDGENSKYWVSSSLPFFF
ncbi:hypothetical protein H6P81_009548 [Aristolochia fimbriata]|uniref:Uncharacterized protein n=1 Tax=Aristolochia fimbriata TaxID=158543 RepID=A0AAV7EQN0_ARIFI|nr:hypothetical protein H6P81_009548 [Aristolochia fimbriata]